MNIEIIIIISYFKFLFLSSGASTTSPDGWLTEKNGMFFMNFEHENKIELLLKNGKKQQDKQL